MVFYEIRRELVIGQASAQLKAFEQPAGAMVWKEFNSAIWEQASNLWATLRSKGRSLHDANVLITAHTIEYGATIGSGNVAHFRDIGARVEDWNQ